MLQENIDYPAITVTEDTMLQFFRTLSSVESDAQGQLIELADAAATWLGKDKVCGALVDLVDTGLIELEEWMST